MIIHFVAQSFDYTQVSSSATRLDFHEEYHDPLSALDNFNSFFGRIDKYERPVVMSLDAEKVRKAVWDREEFLDIVREVCCDDIYIQATDYYSMKIGFVSPRDCDALKERLDIPRKEYSVMFNQTLRHEIDKFLSLNGVHKNEYTMSYSNTAVEYRMREELVARLMTLKFAYTEAGDHIKASPPLPDSYKIQSIDMDCPF